VNIEERYLDLLKKALTRSLDERNFDVIPPSGRTLSKRTRYAAYQIVQSILQPLGLMLVQKNRPIGETMMGMGALDNLHACLKEVHRNNIPGDLIETGVWRGGGTIFMRAFLMVHGDTSRRVWVADSFEGLPKPSERNAADAGDALWQSDYLAVGLDQVKRNFEKYELLDERVIFLKGFFAETMPAAPIEKLALMRLDGDMYESTMVVLQYLYSKLSPGGYVIIDDYGMIPACDQAVEDFRRSHAISESLQFIGYVNGNPLGAYWQKS
jgi:O-methyltransferase